MRKIGIIGAGISGLTSAFALARHGYDVTLLESSSRVGGVIESVRQDGFLAECGPNTLLETSPRIADCIRDLGLESRKLYPGEQGKKRFIVRGKRPIPMPASPLGFFTCPLFSIGTKWNLMKEPFIPKASGKVEESLAEFVLRRLGQEFLDYAINPFVAGVYAGDPRQLSVKHAFPKLHALEQKYGSMIKGQILGAKERKRRGTVSKQNAPMVSFPNGLQELLDALESKLKSQLLLNHRVRSVIRNESTWSVTATAGNSEVAFEWDGVLLTAPAYVLSELECPRSGEMALRPLSDIQHPPVTSVVLGYKRDQVRHPLDGFGMLVPEKENLSILGTLFTSSLFPGRAPEDCVTLTSYVGGMRQPELAGLPEGELLSRVRQDLQTVLGVNGEPCFRNIRSYRKAIPQYVVGYGKYKTLLDTLEADNPGLFFAGNYRTGISLSDTIVSGLEIADRIHETLESR